MPDKRRSPERISSEFSPVVFENYQTDDPAMSRTEISTYIYCGPKEEGASPGVSVNVYIDESYLKLLRDAPELCRQVMEDGQIRYRINGGVMSRQKARQLRNMLTGFLLDFPEEEPR